MAACCTKGDTASCTSDINPAFENLVAAQKPGANVNDLAMKSVGILLVAVRKRVSAEQVSGSEKTLMSLCPNAPTCSW